MVVVPKTRMVAPGLGDHPGGLGGRGGRAGAELGGQRTLGGGAGDADDRGDAARSQQLQVELAGDAEADHHGALAGEDVQHGLGVHAGRQHLQQRGGVVADGRRERVELQFVDGDQLGEAAVQVAAHEAALAAEVAAVAQAQLAVAAGDPWVDQHPGALTDQAPGAGGDHVADHLVADDQRHLDRDRAAGDLEVGPAQPGAPHPQQSAPTRVGLGHLLDADRVDVLEQHCSHVTATPAPPLSLTIFCNM